MASITVTFNNAQIMSLTLTKDLYVIGRHPNSDIHIDNLGVSRSHARLMKEGDHYIIEDLNSANGTFVNQTQITRQVLKEGDIIHIGKYTLLYHGDEASPAKPLEKTVPETAPLGLDGVVCTMAMDGDAMRKMIEEMQKQREGAPEKDTKGTSTQTISKKSETKIGSAPKESQPASLTKESEVPSSLGVWIAVIVVVLVAAAVAVYFLLR